jgi:hypothetical protein
MYRLSVELDGHSGIFCGCSGYIFDRNCLEFAGVPDPEIGRQN